MEKINQNVEYELEVKRIFDTQNRVFIVEF